MRVLGALCVVAALVLSTGGVAYRIKADPQLDRVAPGAAAAQADTDEASVKTEQAPDPGACPAPEGQPSKPVVISIEQLPSAKEFISLNSSGYNYSDPRRVPAAAPQQKSPEDSSADSAASESPVPATPRDRD